MHKNKTVTVVVPAYNEEKLCASGGRAYDIWQVTTAVRAMP